MTYKSLFFIVIIIMTIIKNVYGNIAGQYTNPKKYILNKNLFKIYQTEFNKKYNRGDYYPKFMNFIQNTQLIDLNKQTDTISWTAGWTSMSDMSFNDFNTSNVKFVYDSDDTNDFYQYDKSESYVQGESIDLVADNYNRYLEYDFNNHKKVKIVDGDINGMLHAISNVGPIIAQIYFNQELFNYDFGIYSYSNLSDIKKTPNQTVIIVGYTTDYFIIKNSWGNKWGMNGYIIWKRSELEPLITQSAHLYI